MSSERTRSQADAEAIDWLIRRHGDAPGAVDRAAFQAWRARRPENARAAERAEVMWRQLGAAGRPLLAGAPATSRPLARRRLVAGGIAVAAALAGVGLPLLATQRSGDLATGTGELTSFVLTAGVTATLDARSGLDVARAGREVSLRSGRAIVEADAEGARGLLLRVDGHELRPRGAAAVELDRRAVGTSAAALAGAFELSAAAGRLARLGPGNGVRFEPGSGPRALSALELAGAGAWRRGQLVFHDQPLAAVLRDLERYRGGRILLLGGEPGARRVTGVFPLAEPDTALDAIAVALDLTVVRLPLLALVRAA